MGSPVMTTLLIMIFIIAMYWLLVWAIGNDRLPPQEQGKTGIFAMRDADAYRKRYGDRKPF